nr:MAG TPA: hypothetical protein [Caudoviricetes sp.]
MVNIRLSNYIIPHFISVQTKKPQAIACGFSVIYFAF